MNCKNVKNMKLNLLKFAPRYTQDSSTYYLNKTTEACSRGCSISQCTFGEISLLSGYLIRHFKVLLGDRRVTLTTLIKLRTLFTAVLERLGSKFKLCVGRFDDHTHTLLSFTPRV